MALSLDIQQEKKAPHFNTFHTSSHHHQWRPAHRPPPLRTSVAHAVRTTALDTSLALTLRRKQIQSHFTQMIPFFDQRLYRKNPRSRLHHAVFPAVFVAAPYSSRLRLHESARAAARLSAALFGDAAALGFVRDDGGLNQPSGM
eukprot:s42_g13.t1